MIVHPSPGTVQLAATLTAPGQGALMPANPTVVQLVDVARDIVAGFEIMLSSNCRSWADDPDLPKAGPLGRFVSSLVQDLGVAITNEKI